MKTFRLELKETDLDSTGFKIFNNKEELEQYLQRFRNIEQKYQEIQYPDSFPTIALIAEEFEDGWLQFHYLPIHNLRTVTIDPEEQELNRTRVEYGIVG